MSWLYKLGTARAGADGTVAGFLRRYGPFSLALTTAIGLVITLLFSTQTRLADNLIMSYCIGGCILSLNMLLQVCVIRPLRLSFALEVTSRIVSIPAGVLIGVRLGSWWTGAASANWLVAGTFALIGGGFAMLYVVGVERQRRAEQAEKAAVAAKLQVLRAQIEPHFLFNTLATLDELIASDGPQARAMLGHVIKYFRSSLLHVRSQAATLATEFELLEAYLSIMAMRLPQRLACRIECAAECTALPFPPMLVQPLVENAIVHGVEPAADGGSVLVLARRAGDRLVITVQDSGIGLSESPVRSTGTGLATVRERLHSLFGEAGSLSIMRAQPRGTVAEISIPIDLL